MASISSFLFLRHVRGDPTAHMLFFKGGALRKSGRGLSFWFSPLAASLAEVPLDDRELPLLFHGRSSDFQDVTVQGVITYRVVAPEILAERVDFSLDTRTGAFARQPLDKIALSVTQLAQQLASAYLARSPLRAILEEGVERLREILHEGLIRDQGLSGMGLEIVSTRVASAKPTPEMERALMTPTREAIQQEADQATFARRALAVEKERAIQENELSNQIELARREEQLIQQRGQNERRRASEAAASRQIEAEAGASEARIQAEAQAQGIRLVEDAKVVGERARMDIYRDLPSAALMGLAACELAGNLQRIEHLSLAPDLLGPLLTRLAHAGAARLEGAS
jgi:regulator of protease activity HflC (stomatin/prohibitin superfamily)